MISHGSVATLSMRLPRRVPWAAITELEQVCSSIYADENDMDAKIFAINRVSPLLYTGTQIHFHLVG